MTVSPHDWRYLSNILQELRSFDHRFSSALNDYFEIESAVTNASRSTEVAVRGRRNNGFSSTRSAFERIEKYLGPKANIDISLDRIIIPDDGAKLILRPRMNLLQSLSEMNHGIFPDLTTVTIPGSGAAGYFTDVQADLRGVETWILRNALPPRSSAEEPARELTSLNKRKRAAVLQTIASLGIENLRTMSQKDREAKIVNEVKHEHDLNVTDRYVRKLYREML